MDSLVKRVAKIEEEAIVRTERAEAEGREALADIQKAEKSVLEDVRSRASRRAQEIIKERLALAHDDVSILQQDEQRSVEAVHTQSEKNRDGAIQRILELFAEDYQK